MLYIFDWDGTLCNSLEKIVLCLQKAAQLAGEPNLCPNNAKQIIGLALPEAIEALFPHQKSTVRDQIEHLYREVFVKDRTPAPLFNKSLQTLKQLKEQGHKLAVATGKSRKGLDNGLAQTGLTELFCSTRCADETASKPDPLMLLELLDELDTPSSEAVMIGDTTFDMAMAEAANMKRIAVTFGSHSKDQLSVHSPEVYLDCISELLHWQNN